MLLTRSRTSDLAITSSDADSEKLENNSSAPYEEWNLPPSDYYSSDANSGKLEKNPSGPNKESNL